MQYSKIIAAPCACGKSFMAKRYHNAIDVETEYSNRAMYGESTKHIVNGTGYELPVDLFDVVKESIGKYKYILIPVNKELFYELFANDIKFSVVVPNLNSLNTWVARFSKRLDDNSFIKYQCSIWNEVLVHLYENQNRFDNFIILDDNQYLSDIFSS